VQECGTPLGQKDFQFWSTAEARQQCTITGVVYFRPCCGIFMCFLVLFGVVQHHNEYVKSLMRWTPKCSSVDIVSVESIGTTPIKSWEAPIRLISTGSLKVHRTLVWVPNIFLDVEMSFTYLCFPHRDHIRGELRQHQNCGDFMSKLLERDAKQEQEQEQKKKSRELITRRNILEMVTESGCGI
jgi:hypothetical protein